MLTHADDAGAAMAWAALLAFVAGAVIALLIVPRVWSSSTTDARDEDEVTGATSDQGGAGATAQATGGAPSASDGGGAPVTPRAPAEPSGPVTLAFGGDVHFESHLGDAVRADPRHALAPVADLFAKADVAMVNLETAVTDRGSPSPKQYNFRAPDEGLAALRAAGVDVVSLANNHGMDFGEQGLRDTLRAARRADLALVGAGRSARQAYRPHVVTVRDRQIAIFGATQVLDTFAIDAWTARPDRPGLASAKEEYEGLERLLRAVRDAADTADTVVVMLHWGQEGESCPLPRQTELATQLAEAGADIVVGGHAHRLQAGGYLGDTVVHYGLGNFVFYTEGGPGADSGVYSVTIEPDGSTRAKWKPAVLTGGVATSLSRDATRVARAAWRDLRSCTDLDGRPAG